jgi:hypothetical protein
MDEILKPRHFYRILAEIFDLNDDLFLEKHHIEGDVQGFESLGIRDGGPHLAPSSSSCQVRLIADIGTRVGVNVHAIILVWGRVISVGPSNSISPNLLR